MRRAVTHGRNESLLDTLNDRMNSSWETECSPKMIFELTDRLVNSTQTLSGSMENQIRHIKKIFDLVTSFHIPTDNEIMRGLHHLPKIVPGIGIDIELESSWTNRLNSVGPHVIISGCSPDITIEDITLGEFCMELHLLAITQHQVSIIDMSRMNHGKIVLSAIDPNPAEKDSGVTHPHISGDIPCLGDYSLPVESAIQRGCMSDVFDLLLSFLNSYSPSGAYVSINEWDSPGLSCTSCDTELSSSEAYWCEDCNACLCEECIYYCGHCDCNFCGDHFSMGFGICDKCFENEYTCCPQCGCCYLVSEHGVICAGCGDNYCDDCVSGCDECNKQFCSACLNVCDICHEKFCNNCYSDHSCEDDVEDIPF